MRHGWFVCLIIAMGTKTWCWSGTLYYQIFHSFLLVQYYITNSYALPIVVVVIISYENKLLKNDKASKCYILHLFIQKNSLSEAEFSDHFKTYSLNKDCSPKLGRVYWLSHALLHYQGVYNYNSSAKTVLSPWGE